MGTSPCVNMPYIKLLIDFLWVLKDLFRPDLLPPPLSLSNSNKRTALKVSNYSQNISLCGPGEAVGCKVKAFYCGGEGSTCV